MNRRVSLTPISMSLRPLFTMALIGALASCAGSISDEDAIVCLCVRTSWIDRGLRAIVFEDGTVFARVGTGAPAPDTGAYLFRLDKRRRSRIIETLYRNDFLGLPPRLELLATDGTSEEFLFANSDTVHHVYRYMAPNRKLDAIRTAFVTTLEADLIRANAVPREEWLAALSQRLDAVPEGSSKRTAISSWLDCSTPYWHVPR